MLGALRSGGAWAKGPSEAAKSSGSTEGGGEGNRPALVKEGSGKKRGTCGPRAPLCVRTRLACLTQSTV